jgi:serine/threonine protein kinase
MNTTANLEDDRRTRSQATEEELVRVMEAYIAEVEAGRPVDPERLLSEHPSIAEPLRACLATLDFVRRAARSLSRSTRGAAGETSAEPVLPFPAATQLGDFRLLREVGRGGMGVVYEAEQVSLGRRVALKVLPFAAVLDPRQLQRFRNEAQAAAHLHHTNIVPVFAVGCEHGVHYYAMQYIEGHTLADVIRELRVQAGLEPGSEASGSGISSLTAQSLNLSPSDSTRSRVFFRAAAGLGLQAAEALEHAHAMGVVHRDVKPSNLLLDARGNLWVADFGLAKFEGAPGVTMSGDLLGTLRYMSPEQALARRVVIDHRSDIYSLGVTLYELLTLEPAFQGRDRQEVLREIAFGDPRSPRRVNGAVPVELETIVLKAMTREPERRYATARELAGDLRRYLEEKPILARRATLAEKAAKWARRHRTLVRAALVVLVLAVIGLGVSTYLVAGANRRTGAALVQAERNFGKARAVVDRMFTWLSEDPLAKTPHMEGVRKTLLEEALRFYQGFLEERSDDPVVRRELGRAQLRVGAIQEMLGQLGLAEEAFQEALTAAETLASDYPGEAMHVEDAARAWSRISGIRRQTGRREAAQEAAGRAVALRERLTREFPAERAFKLELAIALTQLASLPRAGFQYDEARATYEKALEILLELEKTDPERLDEARALAYSHYNLGMLFKETGLLREAEEAYRQALTRWEKVSRARPAPGAVFEEAAARYSLGVLLAQSERPEPARESYEAALSLQVKLARDFPGVPQYKEVLAATYNSLGTLHSELRKSEEAEKYFREALALQERLAGDYPGVPLYRRELGRSLNNLGIVLQDQLGRPGEARESYSRARDIYRALTTDFPGVPDDEEGLGQSHNNLGSLLEEEGKIDEASASFEEARKLFASLAERFPGAVEPRYYRSVAAFNIARLRIEVKDYPGGRAAAEEAIPPLASARRDYPEDPRFPLQLRAHYAALSVALEAQGDHEELARRARELAEGSPPGPDHELAASMLCASSRVAAGDEALEEGRREALAMALANEALELLVAAVAAGGRLDPKNLREDPALEPLRGREEFQRINARLEETERGN